LGLFAVAISAMGLVSGLAGAALFGRLTAKPPAPAPAIAVVESAASQGGDRAATVDALRVWLDSERTRLRQEAASDKAAAAPNATAAASEPQETLEQARAAHLERHKRALAEHRGAAKDPRWAPAAETSLLADVRAIADLGASNPQVDCRTTTCAIDLEWPSYDAAVQSYSKVLQADLKVNCVREVTLPEPGDRAAAYRATVMLNCEETRTDG
jgi:hypothetical protein